VGSVVPFLTTGCGGTGISSALATAGLSLIGLALVGGPLVLYRAARSPRVRALVGVLWDILTFWPRWHHPFAVRSYAERVVPELQHRILHHVVRRDRDGTPVPEDQWRPLVLSVHSQGTVIALAAIASLPTPVTRKVSVISFGSPLTTLYARFYPAYFGRAADPADAELRGDFADADRRVRRWRNFYRPTDYIGQQVTGVEDSTELPDPCSEQQDWPPPHRVDEAPRVPWTEIAGHSGYRRERAVQQAVADARGLARRAHPPGPPG
jgi:hypothetical protein